MLTFVISLLASSVLAGEQFALIAAISKGYSNYRHQADACHAYHLLVEKGIKPKNIILFLYDDVASHEDNPFKGKLFNKPSKTEGIDVYKDCLVDYSGSSVNPDTLTAVLTGDRAAVDNQGTGRVIESTKEDSLFLFLVGHGSTGFLQFPSGVWFGDDIVETMEELSELNKFKTLTFYLEACYGGSLFEESLPSDNSIYVVTAADSHQSSYATFCDFPFDSIEGTSMGTCLADAFSFNWMEHLRRDTGDELEDQFHHIKRQTKQSNVSRFGDLAFIHSKVAEIQGGRQNNFLSFLSEEEFPVEQSSLESDEVEHFYMKRQGLSKEKEHFAFDNKRIRNYGIFSTVNNLPEIEEKRTTAEFTACYKIGVRWFKEHCEIDEGLANDHYWILRNKCKEYSFTAILKEVRRVCKNMIHRHKIDH